MSTEDSREAMAVVGTQGGPPSSEAVNSTQRLGLTPSQTVGPYLHLCLPWTDGPDVVPEGTSGAFVITGRVFDGNGGPVVDALVESWQADPAGRFDHPDDPRGPAAPELAGFRGFGRCDTNGDGRYWLRTVKPGALPTPGGDVEAPHLDISVFARGLLNRVVTRLYFADEAEANAADPVLRLVDPERRTTLLAMPGPDGYAFDIHLQGPDETVFFDV
jgi:protocatechuate 3,4-dioxygenase alpha subunit